MNAMCEFACSRGIQVGDCCITRPSAFELCTNSLPLVPPFVSYWKKAGELSVATRKGLADCADELAPDYVAAVEQALAGVAAALATEQAHGAAGDLARLQAACTQLDEATKPLADLLMDKAMTAMLQQRGLIR